MKKLLMAITVTLLATSAIAGVDEEREAIRKQGEVFCNKYPGDIACQSHNETLQQPPPQALPSQPPVYYPLPPPPPPPPTCVVTGPWWVWQNVRLSPNGPIMFPLPPGTPVVLLGTWQRWGQVQAPLGSIGWMFLPYMRCA